MAGYEGYGQAGWRPFEDYSSLKKHINSGLGRIWDPDHTNEISFLNTQLSTGTLTEILSLENGAVSYIGKTELTLVGACSANDNAYDGMIVTCVYKSNDGVEHTATCTVDTDNSTNEIAFVDATTGAAVTDYYCCVSATSNTTLQAAETFGAGATGALTTEAGGFVIAAQTTAATEATMGGVGMVYCRSHSEDNAADSTVNYLDYMTPWGEVKKNCTSTLTTTSVNEIRFFESDGTTTVKDFYIPIWFGTSAATTANTHERLLTDSDIGANTDGSGSDVYGCINELVSSANFSRMTAPESGVADVWLGKVCARGFIANALGDQYIIQVTLTPKGQSYEKTLYFQFSEMMDREMCIPLAPDTSCTVKIADTATATNMTIKVQYIVAKRL